MQEGTSSLMQMAKVAVAVEALRQAGLPFVAGSGILMSINPIDMTQLLSFKYCSSLTIIIQHFDAVLNDPTYGGVSASYAMQADIRIAMSDARIGNHRTEG